MVYSGVAGHSSGRTELPRTVQVVKTGSAESSRYSTELPSEVRVELVMQSLGGTGLPGRILLAQN
jgi:hypothetical protein